jgi:DNA-binding response OmpR family regulator
LKAVSVLLVEDSGEVRDLILEILTREGYEVKSTDNGLTAWEILNSETFDLVISDMDIPGMDGPQLMQKMRSKSVRTPVLLTSGVKLAQSQLDRGDFPPYRLLCKPFGINEIKEAITELLDENNGRSG